MSGAEALARALHSLTDGLDGEGTATWPDPAHREVYALAVEEVAQAILADPGPLLEALAEAGVLREVYSLARHDPQPRMDGSRVQHAGAHDRVGMIPRDPLNPPVDNLTNQKG